MTLEQVKATRLLLVQCLINNQLFDAALSTMGYTLAGMAVRENPRLADPAQYFHSHIRGGIVPEGTPEISIDSVLVYPGFEIEGILNIAEHTVQCIGDRWMGLLDWNTRTVVWDSVRVGFVPSGDEDHGGYEIRLISAYVKGSRKGEGYHDGRSQNATVSAAMPGNPGESARGSGNPEG